MANIKERTLLILKPDAMQRGLFGEIVERFENKGLKIVGMKMIKMSDLLLDEHYVEHKGKPFLPKLKSFMMLMPVALLVFEGLESVKVVRAMCGPTQGRNAPPGTIRGDFSMSGSNTIVHSSENIEAANREIGIFFREEEMFHYAKPDEHYYYGEEERGE